MSQLVGVNSNRTAQQLEGALSQQGKFRATVSQRACVALPPFAESGSSPCDIL
jgi:hypothetical protein